MRFASMSYLPFLGLCGILYGCMPEEPKVSGTPVEIGSASEPGTFAPSKPGPEPAQRSRPAAVEKAGSAPAGRPASPGAPAGPKHVSRGDDTD
jgi:hypothetical protein